MHGLHRVYILADHGFQAPAALHHIPLDPADDADICICIHEYPDIHEIAEAAVFKDQDPLHDHHLPRLYGPGPSASIIYRIIINGTFHRPSLLQLHQMADQKLRIKGIGMVVV